MNDLDREDPWEKRLTGRTLEIRTRCWTCYGYFWHVPGVRRCRECFEDHARVEGLRAAAEHAGLLPRRLAPREPAP